MGRVRSSIAKRDETEAHPRRVTRGDVCPVCRGPRSSHHLLAHHDEGDKESIFVWSVVDTLTQPTQSSPCPRVGATGSALRVQVSRDDEGCRLQVKLALATRQPCTTEGSPRRCRVTRDGLARQIPYLALNCGAAVLRMLFRLRSVVEFGPEETC